MKWLYGLFVVAACGQEGAVGPEGAPGPQGPEGAVGAPGAQGEPGADGALRVYGNGSAGALTVSANGVLFSAVAADGNLQFTDMTINAGVELYVPSGVVIRCTGTFTNNGTIYVFPYAQGGRAVAVNSLPDASAILPAARQAHPGLGVSAALNGEYGDNTVVRAGGAGGESIESGGLGRSGRAFLVPGPVGGAGGGGTAVQPGAPGGGTLVILAGTAINNAGYISANAALHDTPILGGAGGGGGGLVVLASRGSITSVMITANGSDGAPSGTTYGRGGGGGGGIVHLLAPTISAGSIGVDAGNAGSNVVAITSAMRSGGGGGGAGVGGRGGNGGIVQANNSQIGGFSGNDGIIYQSNFDPTALF